VHHSDHVVGLTKRTTLWTVWACSRLSRRLPARVVCCSERSRELYLGKGFAPEKILVIPNGFDTGAYRPDPVARLSVRQELGLDPNTPLIGLVARYHVLKDHTNFLRAAAELARRAADVRFVLCGQGVDASNAELVARVASLGLSSRVLLLGHREDSARVQAALDVATSSSVSEAFPLAVGEAMACGVPCVVTDVGDSARIVGPFGRVVPPRDPRALAAAWLELLVMDAADRGQIGQAARGRVRELFDLDAITRRYEALYTHLATGRPPEDHPVPAVEALLGFNPMHASGAGPG
jgi:glycosyltransferase involved in cell wall biosynthesis